MKDYDYTVLFEPAEEGGYNVHIPAIPEICTFGENMNEAKKNTQEAIECYLESQVKEGLPIPKNIEPTQTHISVSI